MCLPRILFLMVSWRLGRAHFDITANPPMYYSSKFTNEQIASKKYFLKRFIARKWDRNAEFGLRWPFSTDNPAYFYRKPEPLKSPHRLNIHSVASNTFLALPPQQSLLAFHFSLFSFHFFRLLFFLVLCCVLCVMYNKIFSPPSSPNITYQQQQQEGNPSS